MSQQLTALYSTAIIDSPLLLKPELYAPLLLKPELYSDQYTAGERSSPNAHKNKNESLDTSLLFIGFSGLRGSGALEKGSRKGLQGGAPERSPRRVSSEGLQGRAPGLKGRSAGRVSGAPRREFIGYREGLQRRAPGLQGRHRGRGSRIGMLGRAPG